jgi:hypothetical protein
VLSTRFSYLYGSEGQRGNIQQISYNDGFSLSLYRNALSAENCNTRSAGFDAVNGCYRTLSVMFSVPVGAWYASLGIRITATKDGTFHAGSCRTATIATMRVCRGNRSI